MDANQVINRSWGTGQRLAVVMSPVMPEWDEGQFFMPLIEPLLEAGYRIVIYDTLSLLAQNDEPLRTFCKRWQQELLTLGKIDLLAGSALGGAVVQTLLGGHLGKQVTRALLISSPTWADEILDSRLRRMADLAASGDIDEALRLLDRLVQPANQVIEPALPKIPVGRAEHQARRLDQGFKLLLGLDVKADVGRYAGPLLSVFGEHSQLVRGINVQLGRRALQSRLEIPGGGMRPLLDAPGKVRQALREHLAISLGEMV